MGIIDRISNRIFGKSHPSVSVAEKHPAQYDSIYKAYVPDFLYKPPFGYPRKVNLPFIRQLSTTPYVFSVCKTLCDEASSLEWDIRIRADVEDPEKWEKQLQAAKDFFKNPNKNEESWEFIQRSLIRDICEIDSGIIVKVFNKSGEFIEIYARDGTTFLKNPDIYGTISGKDDFITPVTEYLDQTPTDMRLDNPVVRNYYDTYAQMRAAYFQYGWTAGSLPVPFGKREIVYIMGNPRTDSIYGRSPVEILADIIQMLHYGELYNLDFYLNSNIPEGMMSMPGVQKDELEALSRKFHDKITIKDTLDNERRIGHKIPFTSSENAKFIPFTLSPKEMMIVEQQKWFSKILWMCFGVTPDEMGITDTSNRAISGEQAKVFKRKAIRPICNVLTYHVNTQLLPEFVVADFGGDWNEAIRKCPLEFYYNDFDVEMETKKREMYKLEIDMGIKTPEMVAEELGINVEDLKKSVEERAERFRQAFKKEKPEEGDEESEDKEENIDDEKKRDEKREEGYSEQKSFESEMKKYIKDVDKALEKVAGDDHAA